MNKSLIKLGLIGLFTATVLCACVKKEESDKTEQSAASSETTLQENATASSQGQYTSLQEVQQPTSAPHAEISDDQKTVVYDVNASADQAKPRTERKHHDNSGKSSSKPDIGAQTHNPEDDEAVAAALQAAQPALEN